MSCRLIVQGKAETDVVDAAQWYEAKQPNLGGEFTTEVRRIIEGALANPLLYPIIRHRPEVHRALTRRFPYSVFYILRRDAVIVFAVLHAKRSDAAWKERT